MEKIDKKMFKKGLAIGEQVQEHYKVELLLSPDSRTVPTMNDRIHRCMLDIVNKYRNNTDYRTH